MVSASAPQAKSTTFTVDTLKAVLARGQQARPELACRMQRAAAIVALRQIEPATSGAPGAYWVQSESCDREYWVVLDSRGYRGDTCTCKDYVKRGGPCKHAIAVRLLQACERAEARKATNVTPLAARTLTDDEPI